MNHGGDCRAAPATPGLLNIPFKLKLAILLKLLKTWKIPLDQTLRIWLGIQFSRPTPELGPIRAKFEPKSINSQKSENLQWEKCRYITGREKTFSDTAQYLTYFCVFV